MPLQKRNHWQKLNHNIHVLSVSTSYSSKVKTLRRISFLPKATLETIYYRTVIPSTLYGIAVWGSCSDYLMKDLELTHLRAARLILKQPRDMADETVIINANWMSLNYFYWSCRGFYNVDSDDKNSLVVKNAYSLRKLLNFAISRPRTEQGCHSFKHRGTISRHYQTA